MITITLLITRADLPESSLIQLATRLGQESAVELFFVDAGLHWAESELWDRLFLVQRRMECVSSRKRLGLPPLAVDTEVFGGGLLNLGEMVNHSDRIFTLPHCHWPIQTADHAPRRMKRLALILDHQADPPIRTETLRIAVGLAGCNHRVTLLHTGDHPPDFPPEAAHFLAVAEPIGINIQPMTKLERFDAILEV